jgi:hypothetical protein
MADLSVLTDEFARVVENACSKARSTALEAGHVVVYRDADGGYIAEYPEGRRFAVRFDSTRPRESHMVILREISSNAA